MIETIANVTADVAPFLVLLGFSVGILGGFFGIGGAFIATPALNLLGFPMAVAIGTDLAHICLNSVVASWRHWRLGNVDFRLGFWMLAGTAIGVWLGKDAVLALEARGWLDTVVRCVYVFLLAGIGLYMWSEYANHRRKAHAHAAHEPDETRLARWAKSVRLPPRVDCPASRIRGVSLWVILGVGALTGFLAGFLGVGGGFIRMPALLYALGVPTTVAVGTDLFEIALSSAAGAMLYAAEGRVDFAAVGWMLLGAIPGSLLGANATQHVPGRRIRLYFAVTVLCAAAAVGLKQLAAGFDLPVLGGWATGLLFGAAGGLTALVLWRYGAAVLRASFLLRRPVPRTVRNPFDDR